MCVRVTLLLSCSLYMLLFFPTANVFIIIFFNSFCNLLWRRVHAAISFRYNFFVISLFFRSKFKPKKGERKKKKRVSFSLRRNATRKRGQKVSLKFIYTHKRVRYDEKKKRQRIRWETRNCFSLWSRSFAQFTFSPPNNKHFSAAQLSIEFGSFNSSTSASMVGCTENI